MTPSRFFSSARSRIAVGLGLVVFLVLVGTGTAQATWAVVSSALSATASSTNAQVSLSSMSSLNTTYNYTGSASPFIIQPVTLKNTGGAPLSYALTDTNNNATLAAKIKVWIWLQASGSCGTVVAPATPAGTLAALPALPSGANSAAAGVTTVICVATQLQGTAAASAGTSVTANFTLTGKVGTNWQDTDGATSTQTVFQTADVTGLGCVSNGSFFGGTATVSWTLPSGATGVSIYDGTTLVSTVNSPTTSFTATSSNVGNATSITIKANYAGGTQSSGVTQPLQPNVFIFQFGTSCG